MFSFFSSLFFPLFFLVLTYHGRGVEGDAGVDLLLEREACHLGHDVELGLERGRLVKLVLADHVKGGGLGGRVGVRAHGAVGDVLVQFVQPAARDLLQVLPASQEEEYVRK